VDLEFKDLRGSAKNIKKFLKNSFFAQKHDCEIEKNDFLKNSTIFKKSAIKLKIKWQF